jgi:predicted heme/steroid binding protein
MSPYSRFVVLAISLAAVVIATPTQIRAAQQTAGSQRPPNPGAPIVIREGQTIATASGAQTQVFATVLFPDPNDPEHATDPMTGRNFHWDADKKQWVNSQAGQSVNFSGYLSHDGTPGTPVVIREGQTIATASGAQTQVLATVLFPDPNDPEHATDPMTGRNFHWDADKKQWGNSQTGQSVNFSGYLTGAPAPSQLPAPGTTAKTAPSTQAPATAPPVTPPPPASTSFAPSTAPASAGFDGAVLFPLGNRVLVDPTAGPQWVDSTIIKAIGGGPPPSTRPQSTTPAATAATKTIELPNTDYGPGGKLIQQTDATGAFHEGAIFDSNGIMRHDEAIRYDLGNGKRYIAEKDAFNYDFKGHLQIGLQLKYDVSGALNSSDFTHYGLHGERTSEEITNYTPGGYEIKDWSIGSHEWTSLSTTYKFPTSPGTTTPAPIPYTPANSSVGVLFPRNFHPGDTITGSLWPSSYADNFKTVPGLSEYDFPIQLYHLPDGSPSWSSLEIGVPGDGYVPVSPNGLFSLHIPLNWNGPLTLQARQPDPISGLGPSISSIDIGNPVAAPTLSSNWFSPQATSKLGFWTKLHLISLWDDADDLEDELDDEYSASNPDWDYIDYLEDELDDVYDEIDYIHFAFQSTDILRLAQNLFTDSSGYNTWLGNQPNLTTDDQTYLKNSTHWTKFLKSEIDYSNFRSDWGPSNPVLNPYWTNPILTQGKLNVLRGSFFGDPLDTRIRIDDFPITPIGATPYETYFMPPTGLTYGLHNEYIDNPLFGETIFPVFYMTLTMGAGQLSLHKGQSTTYFARLDIANGLPSNSNLFGSPPSYNTDLIDPTELSSIQQAAGSSRTGFISFSVTNQSTGTIAMQNQFRILNASNFVPSGSYQINGGITAIMDGGFSILGLARANLAPEVGLGITPGSSPAPGTSTPNSWYPSFNLNSDPATFSNSSFMTNCSAPATIPTTASQGASIPPTTTPGTPTTTPATTTPTIPASTPSTGETTPSDCPSAAVTDLYNDATGNPSVVPVGNPPSTADIDAAKKRVDDARAKFKAATAKNLGAIFDKVIAWSNAISRVPQSDRDYYSKWANKYEAAEKDYQKMEDRFTNNPTAQNEREYDRAKRFRDEAKGDYEAAELYIVDQFQPADRAAWEKAEAAEDQAQRDTATAEDELHEAEAALDKLTQSATTN